MYMSVCSIFRGIIEANAHTNPDPTLQDAGNKASSSLAAVNFGIDLRGNVGICIHTIPNSKDLILTLTLIPTLIASTQSPTASTM